jgi:hypothetical protein
VKVSPLFENETLTLYCGYAMNLLKPLLILMTLVALNGCGDKDDDSGETTEDTATEE